MFERLLATILILGTLYLLWLGWQWYKSRLVRTIRSEAAEAGQPTLLYFWAEYCAPCRLHQAPIIDRLTGRLGEKVVVRKIDVSQNPDLATQYKVATLPTTVILDQTGQVRHINYGVASQDKLEGQLQPQLAAG